MERTDATTFSWILLAIYFWDKSSVTRAEILHSADAIDHAAPTENELDRAIAFLTQHGLVEELGHSFGISAPGRAILESADSGPGNIYDVWKILESRIARPRSGLTIHSSRTRFAGRLSSGVRHL